MVNYPNDTELEEDYKIGWEWLEKDPGPLIASYTDFCQYLLDPLKNKLEDFFNAFFDHNMCMIMARETKRYVHRKKETDKYKKCLLF